ncbi:unnamed protein product [Rotaria sordida]|uniref:Uncharacterized protein n=1 Tax=Rotaria sordida TaxID=392033 RepID=A0A819BNE1_9BILA|nr:unnamed protein product [Rotaria sordida]
MKHLEKLALYLRLRKRYQFVIDGKHLYNEILANMPQLHTFTFYMSTDNYIQHLDPLQSIDDIQQAYTNIKYGQTICIIDYFDWFKATFHIYSLPFTFTRLKDITSQFPTIGFCTVTYLSASDVIPMEHEFFMRISRDFPMLKCFTLKNRHKQEIHHDELKSDKNASYSIIEYSHLISLDLLNVHIDYVVQFLLETKTHIPHLTELKLNYNQLETVTMNFTRDVTRRNCAKVNRLIINDSRDFSKDIYQYFPSLKSQFYVDAFDKNKIYKNPSIVKE